MDAAITGLLVAGTIDPIDFITRVRAMRSSLPIIVVTACIYNDRIAKAQKSGSRCSAPKAVFP